MYSTDSNDVCTAPTHDEIEEESDDSIDELDVDLDEQDGDLSINFPSEALDNELAQLSKTLTFSDADFRDDGFNLMSTIEYGNEYGNEMIGYNNE